ncbi:MAG: hypothetical protein CMLOHMNK_00703 [Steroidobacteraceae bacterium]|nr:hypothetical protein [Steroidobacteraceae bacterium]
MTNRLAGFAATSSTLLFTLGCDPATGDPELVRVALDTLAGECTRVGGTPHIERAVQRADLNADGHGDYVLYAGWIECGNAASIYGDRTKSVAVFCGDGRGGAAETFADSVYDARIESGSSSAPRLWMTVSAELCGRPPALTFAAESFCDRAIDWNAATGRFDYAPLDTIRMIE